MLKGLVLYFDWAKESNIFRAHPRGFAEILPDYIDKMFATPEAQILQAT